MSCIELENELCNAVMAVHCTGSPASAGVAHVVGNLQATIENEKCVSNMFGYMKLGYQQNLLNTGSQRT